MDEQKPIFFAATRSFWLTVLGVAALLVGDIGAVKAFAELIALALGTSPLPIVLWVQKLAPAVLFVAALQQRMGKVRPYSTKLKDK
jgi:hypothetical protein